jgi:ketosteroid isomerase-like protein
VVATPGNIQDWLDRFAAAVRAQDLDAGRALFAHEALGYGTRTAAADGLDALVAAQWAPVWAATSDFAFAPADLLALASPDQAVVAARWSSRSASGAARTGRATLVLVLGRGADGALACVHSHFSLDPVDGGRLT